MRPTDYDVPTDAAGLLPWSWAIEQLEEARNFWFATMRPDVAARLAAAFTAKFGASHDYRLGPTQWDQGGLWLLRPHLAFAWREFPRSVTRWTFPDAAPK